MPGAASKRNAKDESTAHSRDLSVPSEGARNEKSASMEEDSSFLRRTNPLARQEIATELVLARSLRNEVERSGVDATMLSLASLTGTPGAMSFRGEAARIADAREPRDASRFSLLGERGPTSQIASGMRTRGSQRKAATVVIQHQEANVEPAALGRVFRNRIQ